MGVISAGVTGYGSLQGLRLARRHLAEWQPDIVTICYGWNDHWIAANGVEDCDQVMPPQWQLDIQNLLTRSAAYRWLKYLVFSFRADEVGRPAPSRTMRISPEDYSENIGKLISFSQRLGAMVVLITPPIADYNAMPNLAQWHQHYTDRTRALAEEFGVPLVDAAAGFRGHPEFFDDHRKDYIHCNSDGHRYVAEMLKPVITRLCTQ